MKQALMVKSSSGSGSYTVEFVYDDKILSLHCDCQAGALGKLCKHKIGLLQNDVSLLAFSNQSSELEDMQEVIRQTRFPDLLKHLDLAESELGIAQAKVSSMKKVIEKAMKNGA